MKVARSTRRSPAVEDGWYERCWKSIKRSWDQNMGSKLNELDCIYRYLMISSWQIGPFRNAGSPTYGCLREIPIQCTEVYRKSINASQAKVTAKYCKKWPGKVINVSSDWYCDFKLIYVWRCKIIVDVEPENTLTSTSIKLINWKMPGLWEMRRWWSWNSGHSSWICRGTDWQFCFLLSIAIVLLPARQAACALP